MNSEFYDYIVVGSGFSGAICARELALRGKTVLLLEKRNHIAGNMYDYYDNHHLLIHKYGPHVIMTDQEEIVQYISAFDRLIDIEVKMEVNIKNKTIPLPINLNSIQMLYDLKGKEITEKLIHEYGLNQEINILDLLKNPDPFQ